MLTDRKAITNHYIPEIHENVKSKVKNSMQQGLLYFLLTTNGWTSRANHSYVTHTAHYLDETGNFVVMLYILVRSQQSTQLKM